MTNPRHAQIIRFWTLMAVVVVCAFWLPDLWLPIVPAIAYANRCGNCGCGGGGTPCDGCPVAGGPEEFQLVSSGYGDSHCTGCSSLNGTFVLSYNAAESIGSCVWDHTHSAVITCTAPCSTSLTNEFRLSTIMLGAVQRFTVTDSVGNAVYIHDENPAIDCNGVSSLSVAFIGYSSPFGCASFPGPAVRQCSSGAIVISAL